MRRKTSPSKRRRHNHILEVRVTSPRILWFSFLRFLFRIAKFAFLLALIAGIAWGGWLAIRKTFHKNPDFRLTFVDLNQNPVIDELQFTQIAGIDLSAQPTVFDVHPARVKAALLSQPGIETASVRRDLPNALVVRITPRTPQAWIAPENATETIRQSGGMLVDAKGFLFPCTEKQLETAQFLPVFHLSGKDQTNGSRQITGAEIERCFRLLDSAARADAGAPRQIESIRQANAWSMELVTRDGITATFSFGGHDDQIARFRLAIEHAAAKGTSISTINLIPRHNVPFTTRNSPAAISPVSMAAPNVPEEPRSTRDIRNLINRN